MSSRQAEGRKRRETGREDDVGRLTLSSRQPEGLRGQAEKKKRDNLLRSCLSCGTRSNYRTILHDMQEIYDFAVWMEVYE